ncbi:MAG TPA: CocE/NonD family hydrolase [Phycisphaerae bacterium]|nr:CocE/NonD family hydrolase [Phycisphaerae bacterium]
MILLCGLSLWATGCASRKKVAAKGSANGNAAIYAPPASANPDKVDHKVWLAANYTKQEHRVPMRDGVHLLTQVFTPRNTTEPYPMLMIRTPYSCNPYGETDFPDKLGPQQNYDRERYIFVRQDVRGCFMSEGTFVDMRPHLASKASQQEVDESTDTYDTIEWLVKNVPNNNGRVGLWGISYPGFYAAAGMIDAHPALKAVSPQAPCGDWYFDDFHHHGAFFLPHAFGFMSSFCQPRDGLTTEWNEGVDYETPDGYQFFMDMGPLKNANEQYFHDELACWNDIVEHPDYDEYWQSRNIVPHLNVVAPAVLTVGGWYDAEDLYGPLKIYRSVEEKNPGVFNALVMGPWSHGGWSRTEGDQLGNIHFDAKTSHFYLHNIEMPFFRQHLKQQGTANLPEAFVFETGENRWRRYDAWPPAGVTQKALYLQAGGKLDWAALDDAEEAFDEYVSDPAKPVPFIEEITTKMTKSYMTDDQRFAGRRPDVLAYQTEVIDENVTLAGPAVADFWVSTSGTDSDWIVKLIDVFPADEEDTDVATRTRPMGGYQMLVRGEVLRGRYRNSYEKPEAFTPGEPAHIEVELLDVLHTFKAGHRIMVQVQSTWFPMVDRNPQTFVPNIFLAEEGDFVKATQRVYRSGDNASSLRVGVLNDP